MYAIFEDGGKQYKVSQGDHVMVELRDLAENQTDIAFDKILMLGEGEQAKIGAPWIAGAKVSGRIIELYRTPRVTGMKFNRRKGYRRKWGHRQNLLRVEITSIA